MTWSGHLMKKLEDAVTLAWNDPNEVSNLEWKKRKDSASTTTQFDRPVRKG
jgi:hypothetical protein